MNFTAIFLFHELQVYLHKLQCVQNSFGRLVTNTTKNSHITLYLRLPYWSTSSSKVVILNILNLFLNLYTVCTILIELKADGVMLEVSHFASSVYNSISTLVSALHMMSERFEMIYVTMCIQSLLSRC